MDTATVIAIGALIVNFVTLGIVIRQTTLTRRAVDSAEISTSDARKRLMIDRLPESGSVIHVMVSLDFWARDIDEVVRTCEHIVRSRNPSVLRELARRGPHAPEGILDRYIYDHVPPWLKYIYAAGAQHYFQAVGCLDVLWNDEEDRPQFENDSSFGVGGNILKSRKDRLRWIRELRGMLEDILPEAYMESPARLSVNDFFRSKE